MKKHTHRKEKTQVWILQEKIYIAVIVIVIFIRCVNTCARGTLLTASLPPPADSFTLRHPPASILSQNAYPYIQFCRILCYIWSNMWLMAQSSRADCDIGTNRHCSFMDTPVLERKESAVIQTVVIKKINSCSPAFLTALPTTEGLVFLDLCLKHFIVLNGRLGLFYESSGKTIKYPMYLWGDVLCGDCSFPRKNFCYENPFCDNCLPFAAFWSIITDSSAQDGYSYPFKNMTTNNRFILISVPAHLYFH